MDSSEQAPADRPVTLDLEEALQYGVSLREQGNAHAARDLFRRILDAVPDEVTALNCLGVLEHQLGDSARGVELLVRALDLDPGYIDAHNNLGNVYREAGHLDKARGCYERALEMDPDFPSALWNIAEIYRKEKDFDHAIPIYKRAAELWPTNARVLETLGMCLRIAGQIKEAICVFRQWSELDPENPAARYLLASVSGEDVPERAGDAYVRRLFDGFADDFDRRLEGLEYRAPALVAEAVRAALGTPDATRMVLDIGCGTGLCGPALRPYAGRLYGIDLSARMLERARERGCYDNLVESELTAWLGKCDEAFDLIVSADTLCYLGRLETVFEHCARVLAAGGHLVFTVEASEDDGEDYRLCPHGRYSHARHYLERCAKQAGLSTASCEAVVLRKENEQPVSGFLVVAVNGSARPPG